MDSLSRSRRVGFGDYVLDVERRVLIRQGKLVKLPAKVVDTLVVLVGERGEVVTKEALLARVWPTTIVEESGLQRNISLLRKAFLENGGEDYIETVPKRGYRFTGELQEVLELPLAEGAAEAGAASKDAELPTPMPPRGPGDARRRALRLAAWVVPLLLILGTVGVLLTTFHRTDEVQPPRAAVAAPLPVITQLTRNPAQLTVVAAAISPNGRYFVYDEGTSLRLREVASGAISELPVPAGRQILYATWMPSNEEILLTVLNPGTRRAEIWRVFVSKSQPVQLLDDASLPGASPRGDLIAFTRGSFELWTTSADGTDAELFLEAPATSRVYFRPGFSRDGKRIYVVGFGSDEGWNLAVYDIATKRRVFRAGLGPVQDFTLLDDTTMLASMATSGGVYRGVYLAVLSLDFQRQTVVETGRLPDWPYYRAYELSATADGRRGAFVRDQTQSDIYVADLARDGDSLSNARRLTLDDGADRVTGWSADSRRVLFHASRESLLGIYGQDIDSPRAQRLRDDGQMNWQPVNSPDGRWLFYMSFPPGSFPSPDHPQTLWRQPMDGAAQPQALATSTHGISAVACARRAPRCIFMNQVKGRSEFSDLDLATGAITRLFTLPITFEFNFNWSVSPDGRSLAYIERNSVGARVAVRELDAQGAMRVSLPVEGSGILRSLAWDTDGSGLFAMQCMGEGGLMLHLDLKGGAKVLRRVRTSCDGWALPSPAGDKLAFVESTSTGNLWMWQR